MTHPAQEGSSVAIQVTQLSKEYHLYDGTLARLKQWFWRPLQRLCGRHLPPFYRRFSALEDVSFDVYQGQTIGIIGRNGSGKSTLLQLISATLSPTEGEIQVNGKVAALLELGAGFNPEFSGRENVYIYASVMGLTREQVNARFSDIEAFAEIGDFIDQPVKAYSSGMLVRLAFAVIVHVDADILIIDEALAVGDAFFVQKCMRFLRHFMAHGTVLFVSHDSSAVTSLCDRAIWLDKGRVRMAGTAKEVTEQYLASQYQGDDVPVMEPARSRNLPAPDEDYHDMRRDLVMQSLLRNDLEIFAFDPLSGSFGQGEAKIVYAALLDEQGRPLSWAVGGEAVELKVDCRAQRTLKGPIVGFFIKDRLGQTLFGDNTYLGTERISVPAGDSFTARFTFRMPILLRGQYSLCLALAEGTQEEHEQHHWLHDAIMIESQSTSVATGLVGIPMRHISLVHGAAQAARDADNLESPHE